RCARGADEDTAISPSPTQEPAGGPASRHPAPSVADVLLMILRRLRLPLIILVLVYAVSIFGLALMPGTLPDGTPVRLGFFHAFYVVTFTATTIGFGEVPYPFTEAQRLWLIFTI